MGFEMQDEGEKARAPGAQLCHNPAWQWPCLPKAAQLSEGKRQLEHRYFWGAPPEPGPEETARPVTLQKGL